MNQFLFCYGSNSIKQLQERLGRKVKAYPAFISGYRRAFRGYSEKWQGGVATLIKKEGETYGLAIEVSPTDIKKLDYYEGYPDYYTRKVLNVNINDKLESAIVYLSNSKKRNDPSMAYLKAIYETVSTFWKVESPNEFYNKNPGRGGKMKQYHGKLPDTSMLTVKEIVSLIFRDTLVNSKIKPESFGLNEGIVFKIKKDTPKNPSFHFNGQDDFFRTAMKLLKKNRCKAILYDYSPSYYILHIFFSSGNYKKNPESKKCIFQTPDQMREFLNKHLKDRWHWKRNKIVIHVGQGNWKIARNVEDFFKLSGFTGASSELDDKTGNVYVSAFVPRAIMQLHEKE